MSAQFVKCPGCGDELSTRYRPIECYKCGPIDGEQGAQPNGFSGKTYGGIGRLGYFLGLLGVVFVNSILGSGTRADSESNAVISVIVIIASITLAALRLQNVGMSGWFALLALVPLANIWIGFTCLAAPTGYNDTKSMDTAGKVISAVFIGFIVLMVLVVILTAVAR